MSKSLYLLFTLLLITSCGTDDGTDIFIPLEIQTQQDFVQVSTLQTISIDIFANDTIFLQPGCFLYHPQVMVM